MKRRTPHESGFTLIEVLVAFVIAALGVTVVFQMIGRGANSLALTEDFFQATLVAESVLYDPDPDPAADGHVGRFRWRKDTAPATHIVETDRRVQPSTRDLTLEDVNVTVTWQRNGRDHAFNLKTQRLVSTNEALNP